MNKSLMRTFCLAGAVTLIHISGCTGVSNEGESLPAQGDGSVNEDGDMQFGTEPDSEPEPHPDASPEDGNNSPVEESNGPVDGIDPDEENDPEPGWTETSEDNLATFSIDVDTASYTSARRRLEDGLLPAPETVRVEEFINFFEYDYEAPEAFSHEPFTVNLESGPSAFGEAKHLLKVGIKGKEVPVEERPATNLVFLVDVSGSMASPHKLGLVKYSLATLLTALRPQDTLGIVVYAGRDAVLLEPTRVEERGSIYDAIEGLRAGGSTNGADGIETAYALAESAFVEGGINRVVLCTDGDFNVGLSGEALVDLVVSWNDRDIALTVLGYGRSFNDTFLEDLTNRANGNYAFIDNEGEALRVLGDRLVGTLQIIAKDVKIQVELDPAVVARYRVIGYLNRAIADEDFRDDTVDAGEIGSGHSVTAFLELELHEGVEPGAETGKLGRVNIRYKKPDQDAADEVNREIPLSDMHSEGDAATDDFRFAAAVAEFGEILAQSPFADDGDFSAVLALAESAVDEDSRADRIEFLALVARALEVSERD